jgi:DNA-directed RNA polymerase subunit RPC12/RpoP
MVVRCSQCGAKIQRKDEGRFFTCPFCRSSLVLEGNRTFGRFIMEHERNDLWAKALFYERLSQAGVGKPTGPIALEFARVPYWVVRRKDGTVRGYPAAQTAHEDIHLIKVPPGRLVFFEGETGTDRSIVDPSIPLGAALGEKEDEEVDRVDLVYLPVYFMHAVVSRASYRAFLVADGPIVHSDAALPARNAISARPLLYFIGTACLLTAVGLAFDTIPARAVALGAAALLALAVSPLAIGKER